MKTKVSIGRHITAEVEIPDKLEVEELEEILGEIKALKGFGTKKETKATVPKPATRTRKRTNKRFTEKDTDLIREEILKHQDRQKLPSRTVKRIVRLTKHPIRAIYNKVYELKKSIRSQKKGIPEHPGRGVVPKLGQLKDPKEFRRKFIKEHIKRIMQDDPTKSYNTAYYHSKQIFEGMANRGKKRKEPFNYFEKLEPVAKQPFWHLMSYFIQTSKILTRQDAEALQLKEGYSWDDKTWEEFCAYLMVESVKICRRLLYKEVRLSYSQISRQLIVKG